MRRLQILPIILVPLILGAVACKGTFADAVKEAGQFAAVAGEGAGTFERIAHEFASLAGVPDSHPLAVKACDAGKACDAAQAAHDPDAYARALALFSSALAELRAIAPPTSVGPTSSTDGGTDEPPPDPSRPKPVSPTLPLPPPAAFAMTDK